MLTEDDNYNLLTFSLYMALPIPPIALKPSSGPTNTAFSAQNHDRGFRGRVPKPFFTSPHFSITQHAFMVWA